MPVGKSKTDDAPAAGAADQPADADGGPGNGEPLRFALKHMNGAGPLAILGVAEPGADDQSLAVR